MNKGKTNKTTSLHPIEGTKGRRKRKKQTKDIRKKIKKKWKNGGNKLKYFSNLLI